MSVEIPYQSTYKSDISTEEQQEFQEYIQDIIKRQSHRVNFYTTTTFTQSSLTMQGSVLSYFFKEYLTIKCSGDSNPVVNSEQKLINILESKIQSHLNITNLKVIFHIPSATAAILCALSSMANFGDNILVLSESHGGHYSQGSQSASGRSGMARKLFNIREFPLNKSTCLFDYEILRENMAIHKPKILLLGFSSYCNLVDFSLIRKICDENNCQFIFDASHTIGLMLSGIIPHSFDDAHCTLGSTYKTIPAVRGGIFITKDSKLMEEFHHNLSGLQVERGLNLFTSSYLGILECLSNGYKSKMLYAIQMAKYIENFFRKDEIKALGYCPITTTNIHMITIKCPVDIKQIFHRILEHNLDIGTCNVPGTDPCQYGLRFICTNPAILSYTLEEVDMVLNSIVTIIEKRDENFQIIPEILSNINDLAKRKPAIQFID